MKKEKIFLDSDKVLNGYISTYTLNNQVVAVGSDMDCLSMSEKDAFRNLKERFGGSLDYKYQVINE